MPKVLRMPKIDLTLYKILQLSDCNTIKVQFHKFKFRNLISDIQHPTLLRNFFQPLCIFSQLKRINKILYFTIQKHR